MEELTGRVKELYVDYVREDLRAYARVADESARKTEQYATALALETEALNESTRGQSVPLEEMETEYESREDDSGNRLLINEHGFVHPLFDRFNSSLVKDIVFTF